VILRGRADHRRAADVDLLDRLRQAHAGTGNRLLEGIERDDHQVDRGDAVALERGEVLRDVAARENAGVDHGMERLHPAVEHLGEPGHLGDVPHGQSRVPEQPGRASG
jgi:hypothetical protein